ncbi:hypothetical protein NPIL_258821, partial [Nephila pilipes]
MNLSIILCLTRKKEYLKQHLTHRFTLTYYEQNLPK